MKVYAISDLHLSTACDKPMNIFGGAWENYMRQIEEDWQNRVTDEDIVLVGGDISWAMTLSDALPDLNLIASFRGKKVFVKGNHDYWWSSISKLRENLPSGAYALQNDAVRLGDVIICGSRGWTVPEGATASEHDAKLLSREILRMEMSLQAAAKLGDTAPVVLMHFPPFNVKRHSSGFTELFEKYGVQNVVYGHLHGSLSRADLTVEKNGIRYYLTSCDLVSNRLVRIL